jgi:hypothetical protein
MRKYESMMSKSEWVAPSLKVGDIAVVLHCYNAQSDDANFSDVLCGDTKVVAIKKNGTVVLRNGDMFFADGYGHAKNKACVLSTHHALDRLPDGKLPVDAFTGRTIARPATRAGHYLTFAKGPY